MERTDVRLHKLTHGNQGYAIGLSRDWRCKCCATLCADVYAQLHQRYGRTECLLFIGIVASKQSVWDALAHSIVTSSYSYDNWT